MSIDIRVEGLDVFLNRLARLGRRVSSDRVWNEMLSSGINRFHRIVVQLSPVDTGSYQASHRVAIDGKTAVLNIDPAARNTRSNILVRRYAAPVENRYMVYRQAAGQASIVMAAALRDMLEEIVK
jgi:hypothetical protein